MNTISKVCFVIVTIVFLSNYAIAGDKPGKRVWVNPPSPEGVLEQLKQGNEPCTGSPTFHNCYAYDPLTRVLSVARVNRPKGVGKNTKELVSYQLTEDGFVQYVDGRAVLVGPHHFAENGNIFSYLAGGLSGAVASLPTAVASVQAARELYCGAECSDTTTIYNSQNQQTGVNTNVAIDNKPQFGVNVGVDVRLPCGGTNCPGGN